MNLLDADALSKLAHWDLLDELALLTGVPNSHTATLSSLVHRASKCRERPDGKLFLDTTVAARAHEYLKQLAPLPAPDEKFIALVQHVPAIDPGEALLFAALFANENSILITGDKRAVTALARAICTPALTRLSGRIVVIEQIILACLKNRGIDWLRKHICPYRTTDKAIGIAMGSDCMAPAESVDAGLHSYIAELQSCAGVLLCRASPFAV